MDDEAGHRPVRQADSYNRGWIERVDLATGAIETLCRESDRALLRDPNGLVFDRYGGLYLTDPGKGRHRALDRGCVCCTRADGSLIREIASPIFAPNGTELLPDGDTLHVAETETGRLWAFELTGPGEKARALALAPPAGGW